MARRKKNVRCPICFERLTHDELCDMYDCPNGHSGDFKFGFVYEETLSDNGKSVL